MGLLDRLRQSTGDLRYRLVDMPAEYRKKWSMSIRDWLIDYYTNVLDTRGSHWMGVRSLKNPLDAWSYQEIMYDTKPDLLLELGSAGGGSTLFFAHMFDLMGVDGTVITVDITHEHFTAEHPRIHAITGDTTDPAVIDEVKKLCHGRRVMMIHDAAHSDVTVLMDLRNYADLVTPGCYLIVEDGAGDVAGPYKGRKTPGPWYATQTFLAETTKFRRDEIREDHVATFAPNGFLLRL